MDRISGFEPEDGSSILSGGTTKNNPIVWVVFLFGCFRGSNAGVMSEEFVDDEDDEAVARPTKQKLRRVEADPLWGHKQNDTIRCCFF